jgi:hypothetical protein
MSIPRKMPTLPLNSACPACKYTGTHAGGLAGVFDGKAQFEVHCNRCETPWIEELAEPEGFDPKGVIVLGPLAVPAGFLEELFREVDQWDRGETIN